MKNAVFYTLILFLITAMANAQETMDLYPSKIPNSKLSKTYLEESELGADGILRISKVSQPKLIACFPEKPNGTAVIICPGGGYRILAISHEGYQIATEFNKRGITAFVLKYRLPSDEVMIDKTIGPLQDAQQAIKVIREHAVKWNLNPSKIGVMGFSAGGHLASTLSTHFTKSVIDNATNVSLRPDFSILGYPVITMDSFTHKGSKNNLLGKNPTQAQVKEYSNERQVTKDTPPTFLFLANDDKAVPSENSADYMIALKRANVPVEAHFYKAGGHGFGLNNKTTKEDWFLTMMEWLSSIKMVD
ncbi:alpha/beta hydrolase [Pedobacter arcticus]|uniref:alpha/beta hydrolase n=1 Tax=Pedobacter arcticus TaxID=752140 RepID=UPI0002E82040|nr:alpha/beta hydrolase [Pedobacter arcticus]